MSVSARVSGLGTGVCVSVSARVSGLGTGVCVSVSALDDSDV